MAYGNGSHDDDLDFDEPRDSDVVAEQVLAGAIASVMTLYLAEGHMPEHAIFYTLERVSTALRVAVAKAGMDGGYSGCVEITYRHPL